jgi:hypothetical protein
MSSPDDTMSNTLPRNEIFFPKSARRPRGQLTELKLRDFSALAIRAATAIWAALLLLTRRTAWPTRWRPSQLRTRDAAAGVARLAVFAPGTRQPAAADRGRYRGRQRGRLPERRRGDRHLPPSPAASRALAISALVRAGGPSPAATPSPPAAAGGNLGVKAHLRVRFPGPGGPPRGLAAGVGFEPTAPGEGRSGFHDRPVRPLRHPA